MTTEVVHHVPDLPDDPRLVDVLRRGAYMVAAAGYFVFPVRPWHKTPAVEDWEHAATRDAIKIGRWWRARPYNLLTGLTRDPPSQMATAEPIARRTSASNVRGGHVEGRHEHHLRDIGAVVLPDWGRVVADDDVGWRVVDPAASPCARCAICRASCWRRCDRHRISRCRRPARCGCPTGRESGPQSRPRCARPRGLHAEGRHRGVPGCGRRPAGPEPHGVGAGGPESWATTSVAERCPSRTRVVLHCWPPGPRTSAGGGATAPRPRSCEPSTSA